MGHQRPIGLLAQEEAFAARDHEEAPVGQPIDGERDGGGDADHDLAPAFEIDRDDLLRAPVAEPETVLVPARRLSYREAGLQGSGFSH